MKGTGRRRGILREDNIENIGEGECQGCISGKADITVAAILALRDMYKSWSNPGQTLVKFWSNPGHPDQTLDLRDPKVKPRSNLAEHG